MSVKKRRPVIYVKSMDPSKPASPRNRTEVYLENGTRVTGLVSVNVAWLTPFDTVRVAGHMQLVEKRPKPQHANVCLELYDVRVIETTKRPPKKES